MKNWLLPQYRKPQCSPQISFGLFISAEYKRSQNPDNHNINLSTSTNNRLVPPDRIAETSEFFLVSFGIWVNVHDKDHV